MKTLHSIIALLLLTSVSLAQIPNGDFENWTNNEPDGWWNSNNALGGFVQAVFQDTNARSGNFAARIIPVDNPNITRFPGGLALGDPTNDSTSSGIPFIMRPDSLKFSILYNTAGSDSIYIVSTLTHYNTSTSNADVVAAISLRYKGNQSSYKDVAVPYNYNTSLVPDSLQIFFVVGRLDSLTGTSGSYALIDKVEFVFNSLSANQAGIMLSEYVNIFPNPSNGTFNISFPSELNSAQADVYDVSGKLIYSSSLSTRLNAEIKLNNISKGAYLLHLHNEKISLNKKIVID